MVKIKPKSRIRPQRGAQCGGSGYRSSSSPCTSRRRRGSPRSDGTLLSRAHRIRGRSRGRTQCRPRPRRGTRRPCSCRRRRRRLQAKSGHQITQMTYVFLYCFLPTSTVGRRRVRTRSPRLGTLRTNRQESRWKSKPKSKIPSKKFRHCQHSAGPGREFRHTPKQYQNKTNQIQRPISRLACRCASERVRRECV